MKYILKKIIIGVSIGLILFFLKGYIVNAKNTTMGLAGIRHFYTDGSQDYITTLNRGTMGNEEWIYSNVNSKVNSSPYPNIWKLTYAFYMPDDLDEDKLYDFTFRLWLPIKNQDYSSNGYPTALVGGLACSAIPSKTFDTVYYTNNINTGSSYSTTTDYYFTEYSSSVVTYNCPNLNFKPNQFVALDVYLAPFRDQDTIGNYRFGINSSLNYVQNNVDKVYSKIQDVVDGSKETNEFLKDTSLPNNSSSDISDLDSNIATNGTISSLVTMPITFLQKIVNGLNGSCSPITIGELYNYQMTMPCINPQQYIGIIWNIIDVICAGFLSFHFSKKLVTIFHKVTSMKDGGLEEAYD